MCPHPNKRHQSLAIIYNKGANKILVMLGNEHLTLIQTSGLNQD